MRCPDEETGRNSVRPCTIPITMAWNSVSINDYPDAMAFVAPGRPAPPLPDEERGEDEGDRREKLDEDVERRAGRVLERIANRVADDRCGVGL